MDYTSEPHTTIKLNEEEGFEAQRSRNNSQANYNANHYNASTNYNANPYEKGNTYSKEEPIFNGDNYNNNNNQNEAAGATSPYIQSPILKYAGIGCFGFYILMAFLASIAFFTTFRLFTDVGWVAFVLFHVLSDWFSIALSVFGAIYIFKGHEEKFNRIYYSQVGIVLCMLTFLCGLAHILDCAYLFAKGINEISKNYYSIRLLFSIVCLFFSFPVYIKVKDNKNLELGSGYGLNAFISQLSCYLTATLILNVYNLADKASEDAEFKFWYKNSLNLFFFIVSMYIVYMYNDFFFGLGFTGYNLEQIVYNASYYQTLVPAIFYFIIGLGLSGYIIYKNGRACIGISM